MRTGFAPLRGPDGADGGAGGLPGIDVKNGLTVMGGNTGLYARMLKKFADSTYYDDLAAAVRCGDTADIQAHAHALKGIAANLSLRPLLELVTAIEQEAKAGAAIPADDERMGDLERIYRRTRESALAASENPALLTP